MDFPILRLIGQDAVEEAEKILPLFVLAKLGVNLWEAYTHHEAQLLDDGRSFSAIATEQTRRAA